MSASDDQTPVADRLDLRLVPVAGGAWAGSWWGTSPTLDTGLALLTLALAVAALLHRVRGAAASLAMVGVLLATGCLGLARHTMLDQSRAAQLADERASVCLVARLGTDVRRHPARGVLPPSASVPADLLVIEGRGRSVQQRVPVQVRGTGPLADSLASVPAGTTLRMSGRLAPADPGQRWAAILTLRSPPQRVRGPGRMARAINHLRAGLRASMRHSPPSQAGLLPSLVVGDTSALDPEVEESFKATGLTHLTAVSGTNLSLTLVFLLGAARWAGARGWWVRATGLFGVAAFVIVCRAEPSVLRAGAMGLVALAGLGLAGGRGRGLRHLCVAVWFLVMIDPWLGRSLGFALSTLATAGILWWGQRWTRAMSWAPAWVGEAVAIPLAAQLATQVVVTSISGSISVVGLAANAVAAPFVGPATVLGLVAALISPLSGCVAAGVGWLAGWAVQPVLWIATAGASLPAATWRWPGSATMLGLLAGLCLVASFLVPALLGNRVLCGAAAALLMVASLRAPQPLGWPGEWTASFCDVGQGDATVLRAAPGQAVVVDVGPDPAPTLGCLRALGVNRVPLLVLTHYHDDHIEGLARLLDAMPVRSALLNPSLSPQTGAARVQRLLAIHGVPVIWAASGQLLRAGAVTWQTVGVGAQAVLASSGEGENSAENDSSIVAVADIASPQGRLRLVLGGDVEPAGQQRVVAQGWQPRAHVLKMPHHGSSRQDQRFWCESGARVAVASAGFRNGYGHPARKALSLANECGMTVLRTDLQGSLSMWVDEAGLQVRAQRDGPP